MDFRHFDLKNLYIIIHCVDELTDKPRGTKCFLLEDFCMALGGDASLLILSSSAVILYCSADWFSLRAF